MAEREEEQQAERKRERDVLALMMAIIAAHRTEAEAFSIARNLWGAANRQVGLQ